MKDKTPSDDKWTPTEILEQVGLGNMDPKEAGITGPIPIIGQEQPNPANLKVLPQGPPKRVFGDKLEFKASVVPLAIRAEWAAQDAKIIPFDKEDWISKNKHTFRIQAELAIGNGYLRLDQTYTDPVQGLIGIMIEGATAVRKEYETPTQDSQAVIDAKASLISPP
jgi:hypothetical protein